MQEKANPRSDRGMQRAVLALSLEAHPQSLMVSGLARQLGAQDVGQAVAALVGAGLLTRDGDAISASVAAVHFDALEL